MSAGYELVVFSDDWHGLPFSCKHLLRHFLPDVPLIWLETIGLRSPQINLYDIRRSIDKFSSWLKPSSSSPQSIPENLHLLNPFQIPYNAIGLVRAFNKRVIIRSLEKLRSGDPKHRRVLITTWPFVGNLVGCLGEDLSVYYRVDDYSEFPGVRKTIIRRFENELIRKVDIVLATDRELTWVGGYHKKAQYLPHGVDFEHFSRHQDDTGHDLPIQQIPAPRIGFFGLLSS